MSIPFRLGAVLLPIVVPHTAHATPRPALPAIVFVSRAANADGQVPGLGPHGTFGVGSGRLLERASDGHIRELVSRGRMLDVADPCVSDDGRRVAFSGVERIGAPWRIWIVDRAGGSLFCATCDSTAGDANDADPCWLGESIVFASTRGGGRALYDGTPVTQLFALTPGRRLTQLTHEANGALDPTVDPRTGRLLFSRWWFNPWTSDHARGVTRVHAAAMTPDSVNVWQVVSAEVLGGARGVTALADVRLAAGGTLPRRGGMAIQPAVLPSGAIVAVTARNTGLAPRPGSLSLQLYSHAVPAPGHRIAGAAIGDASDDPYTEGANLAAPGACAPAALPDGRVVFALDPGGHGDYGLWVTTAEGASRQCVYDEAGTLELDPAVVPSRKTSWRAARGAPAGGEAAFRYFNRDVFAGAGGPWRQEGTHLHVFRLVAPDSIEALQDAPVARNGRVDLALPAGTALFEQLTDSSGRALMSAHGPAQVRGFNSGAPGTTARCVGCHLGHSATR